MFRFLQKAFTEMREARGVTTPWGTGLEWSIVMTLVLCALILIGIAVSAAVYRRRQTESNALWVNLFVLGVLPVFLLVFGNTAVWEYSKQQSFCESCHSSMDPYINDLRRPNGQSLAALHYQDRFAPGTECYSCHANYGVHGTFSAKMLGLSDAWHQLTHTYSVPIKMQQPFPSMLCLQCHNGARKFMAEDSHIGADGKTLRDFFTGNASCMDCHGPSHDIAGKPAVKSSRG